MRFFLDTFRKQSGEFGDKNSQLKTANLTKNSPHSTLKMRALYGEFFLHRSSPLIIHYFVTKNRLG